MSALLRRVRPRNIELGLPSYNGFNPVQEFKEGKKIGGMPIEHMGKELKEALACTVIENVNPVRFQPRTIPGTSTDTELFGDVGRPCVGLGFVRMYQLMELSRTTPMLCFGRHLSWNNWTYVKVRNQLKAVLFTRRETSWLLGLASIDEGLRVGVLHLPILN